MSKQIIAIDVDDVLAATTIGWVTFSNERWGYNLTVDDYDEHWAKMWGVDHETATKRADEMYRSGVVENVQHDPVAVDVLRELAKRYELAIATSRNTFLRKATEDWIGSNFKGLFGSIHMAGIYDDHPEDAPTRTKGDLILSIGADYLVDDQPKHCLAVAGHGKQAILFGDYAWNRDVELVPGVTRCRDWKAVGAYFDGQR